MSASLLILAAGLGTRFKGGIKQLTPVGTDGELLMEYSVADAVRAGFDKVIFIIRRDIKEQFEELIGSRLRKYVKVCCCYQDMDDLPDGFSVPEGRTKPWGTVHAVLAARKLINEPFLIINADDYYGVEAFQIMHDFLIAMDKPSQAAMVGYQLKNTVSIHGAVTRGVCRVQDGRLVDVCEVQKIRLYPNGKIADTSSGEPGVILDPNVLVSMNFWGFSSAIFEDMERAFEDFLRRLGTDDLRGEYPLPVMVDRLLKRDSITVDVLKTDAVWFGVTYQEDRPFVQQALKALHEKGVYCERL